MFKKKKYLLFFFYSAIACWFVGEVYSYFSHVYSGQTRFFAVVNVMQSHDFDEFNIPHVQKDPRCLHVVVVNVVDIIRCVGLLRYSDNPNHYTVSWPYAQYEDRIDKRDPGTLNDLRNM